MSADQGSSSKAKEPRLAVPCGEKLGIQVLLAAFCLYQRQKETEASVVLQAPQKPGPKSRAPSTGYNRRLPSPVRFPSEEYLIFARLGCL